MLACLGWTRTNGSPISSTKREKYSPPLGFYVCLVHLLRCLNIFDVIKAIYLIENVFRVCIAWYKHERGWENSGQLCKPGTKWRVCITVENSPNTSSVYIRLCKHSKKIFYCFYKITLPRKNANALLRSWLKKKFLPVAKSYTRSLARVISSCFAKRCFPKYGLFSLKMSA